jgi:hypothetical protein
MYLLWLLGLNAVSPGSQQPEGQTPGKWRTHFTGQYHVPCLESASGLLLHDASLREHHGSKGTVSRWALRRLSLTIELRCNCTSTVSRRQTRLVLCCWATSTSKVPRPGEGVSGLIAHSTRSDVLGLKTARSGPQQAKGELPNEERVYSSGHDRFPQSEGVTSVRRHHTTKRQHQRPELSV